MTTKQTTGQYDSRLTQAKAEARKRWGAGWDLLSDDQRRASIAMSLVGLIGQIDFADTFEGKLDAPGTPERLLQKLIDIANLCASSADWLD